MIATLYLFISYIWWCCYHFTYLSMCCFFYLFIHMFLMNAIFYLCFTLRCLDKFCLNCFKKTGCQNLSCHELSSCKVFQEFMLGLDFIVVRTYVIHLLGTYVTILCNWLTLWQNVIFLYLGRSRMCLMFERTRFQVQVLKPCKSI